MHGELSLAPPRPIRRAVRTTAPHQALYRRWRAQTFSEIVGQAAVVETLRNAVRTDRVSHAILFVGPRGTGKTSLARILAKALNCTDLRDGDPCDACPSCVAIREGRALDLVEIDAASNRGIDAIRDLRERINYAPTDLRRKVYILDEAHQITKDAWNALLKSLEEPPDFVAFMFASTHPQDFPPAILSRLQRFDVRRLTVAEIEGKLRRILADEAIEAEPAALQLIARLAAGGMRDAESMLDQLLASASGSIGEAAVRDLLGLADAEVVERLMAALVEGEPIAGIAILDELDDRGRDIGMVLDQVIEAIRETLSAGLGPNDEPDRLRARIAVARRLAEIDPERRGVGGLRLQVELALFAGRPIAAPAEMSRRDETPAPSTAVAEATGAPAVVEAPGPPPRVDAAAALAPAPAPRAEAPTPVSTASERRPARPGTSEDPAAARPAPPDASPEPRPAPDAPPPPAAAAADAVASATDTSSGAAPSADIRTVEDLRARWPEIVVLLSQDPPTKPLIAACRPVSLEGNVVTLGFPEGQAFLRDALERRRTRLEEGIGRFLGRPVAVRCVATNLDLVAAPPADDDAAFVLAEARRIFADDLADVGEVS